MVDPAEEKLEVFSLHVEPHVLQEVPELRLAEEPPAFRVVLVEYRLMVSDVSRGREGKVPGWSQPDDNVFRCYSRTWPLLACRSSSASWRA